MAFIEKLKFGIHRFISAIDEICSYAFAAYVVLSILDFSTLAYQYEGFSLLLKLCRYACYLIFFVKIVLEILKERKISLSMVLSALLALVVVICSKQFPLGFLVFVLAAVSSLDFRRLLQYTLVAVSTVWAAMILSSLIGLLPNWSYTRGDIVRFSLGFIYPTDVFSVFLAITMMYCYLYHRKISYYVLAILELINIGLFYATNGRLSFILVNLVLVVMLGFKLLERFPRVYSFGVRLLESKPVKILWMCLPFLLLAICLILALLYKFDSPIAMSVNQLLSDRVRLNSEALSNFPITPFGSYIEWQGWGGLGYVDSVAENFVYNYVDTSYIKIMFDYGIVTTLVAMAAYAVRIGKAFDSKDWITVFLITIVLLWSFVEPYLLSIGRNVFVIFLASLLQYGKMEFKFLHKLSNKLLGEENETV